MTPEDYLQGLYAQIDAQVLPLSSLLLTVEERISDMDTQFLNTVLAVFDPDKSTPAISIEIVKKTFAIRNLLPAWSECVQRVKVHFDVQGLDSKQLLRGLM